MNETNLKVITLSDGRIAKLREVKTSDLFKAEAVAPDKNSLLFLGAVIARITTIDDKQIVPEDIALLPGADFLKLSGAMNDFLSSTAPSSPASSSVAFDLKS